MPEGLVAEVETLVEDVIHPGVKEDAGLVVEAVKVVETFDLGFSVGNAVYLLLAGKKSDRLADLKQAAWYVGHEIARLEKGE